MKLTNVMTLALAAVFGGMILSGPVAAADDTADTDTGDEYSKANHLLFARDHLAKFTKPVNLIYDYVKSGTMEEGFSDEVTIRITKVLPSGRKNVAVRFLSGRKKVRFPPRQGGNGNPVFMYFLENDAREMQRLTGGNALYFRNQIRYGLAGYAAVTPVEFDFNGKTVSGEKITMTPYAEGALSHRLPKFSSMVYSFIISDEIPGQIYQISTKLLSKTGDETLISEVMTFREVSENK